MIYSEYYTSPLGDILLTADEEGLTGLSFVEGQHDETHSTRFEDARRWLDSYFSGKDPGFTPKLHLTGTPFQRRVCEMLLEIPFGMTLTYGDIARRIADERGLERMSAQAVGGALARNPIALIVPCHRVVGANGSLTGYGGGLWRKEALLKLEGIICATA